MTRSDLARLRAARRTRRSRPALFAVSAWALGAWMGYRLRSRAENRLRRWAKYARSRPAPMPPRRDSEGLFIGSHTRPVLSSGPDAPVTFSQPPPAFTAVTRPQEVPRWR